jgi:hypothetical protein
MASKGRKKASLYDLSRAPLLEKDHAALSEELIKGTDRSTALVGCAMVDAALVKAVSAHFVTMKEDEFEKLYYGPGSLLSTYSSRIKIGRCLGIYAEKLNGILDTIRRIRNVFAHSVVPLGFDHELIAKECEKLPEAKLKTELSKGLNPHRERYLAICVNLVIALEDHAR